MACPLRVVLSSSADRNAVLSTFKAYSWEFKSCKICLFPWLSQAEKAKAKTVRQRCIELNDSIKGAKNGLKSYVIISDCSMFRSSSGKLQIVKDQLSATSTQQVQNADSSQPKNGAGGSHVTPSPQS